MTEPDKSFKRLQWNISDPGGHFYITIDGLQIVNLAHINTKDLKTIDLAIIQEMCRQSGIRAQRELDRRAN